MGVLSRFWDSLFMRIAPEAKWDPNTVSYLTIALSIFVPFFGRTGQIVMISGIMLLDAFDGYLARNRGDDNLYVDYLCDRVSEAAMFVNNPLMLKLTALNSVITAAKMRWKKIPIIALRPLYLAWLVLF
jgi:hypothetical protein